MSCNHLYDCLRCGSEVESLEQRIEELEEWIAGIADDHPQIPDWIQQSARSLLAQERSN
jgi:hypothetical protein